ncbi:sporulation histidine kinase inhibitor Sda [Paenibacillus sp. IHBB 10380]|uniref:sporulation histidine kinase inhibitor Sda n=1 Tax=Paenibacillus sp. IHBB 10380 TaxID=1566358 RepID=UPI001364BAA7|nr:sporulation histidine kinase inhibitor Sda [Paenibacillus sp. IHBB 10380]
MKSKFLPSPRPSALESLNDQQLLNVYELAVQAETSTDFIEILEETLEKRHINFRK